MFFTKKGKQESRNERPRQPNQECSEEEKVNICFDVHSFANVFEASPIGIFVLQNRRFFFVNNEFQRISGYSS